jgi:hypothetical protein
VWGKEGFGTLPFDFVDRHVEHWFDIVQLKENISLPTDKKAQPISTKLKVVTSELPDHSIKIDSKAFLDNTTSPYATRLSSALVRKVLVDQEGKKQKEATDENTELLSLNEADQAIYKKDAIFSGKSFFPQETNGLYVNKTTFTAEDMSIPFVRAVRLSHDADLLIRTSHYIFTDEGYVLLKRIYQSLNEAIEK